MSRLAALVLFVAATAHADPAATTGVTKVLEKIVAGYGNIPSTLKSPRFAITNNEMEEKPADYGSLTKWNLAFKVHGGAVAGSAGTSVAWVAANVEATSVKNPKAKPTFYRVLFVYEHAGDAWRLVQASFSDMKPPPNA